MVFAVLAAAALVAPLLLDLAAVFGVSLARKPRWRFSIVPRDRVLTDRFVTGLVSVTVVLSWVLNLGWFRVLFAIPMVVHLVLFRWAALRYARAHPAQGLLLFHWVTFFLGYLLLPDFGDTEDSVRVLFGLVTDRTWIDVLMAVSLVCLAASLALTAVLFVRGRRRAETEASRSGGSSET